MLQFSLLHASKQYLQDSVRATASDAHQHCTARVTSAAILVTVLASPAPWSKQLLQQLPPMINQQFRQAVWSSYSASAQAAVFTTCNTAQPRKHSLGKWHPVHTSASRPNLATWFLLRHRRYLLWITRAAWFRRRLCSQEASRWLLFLSTASSCCCRC